MKKWYVVVDEYQKEPSPEDRVWTVSQDPEETGWNTDSGYDGYGLKKADAEFLALAANEKIERDKNLSSPDTFNCGRDRERNSWLRWHKGIGLGYRPPDPVNR